MPEIKPEQEYFAHLAQGRFMLQRSRSSGEFFFYPRVAAPVTGADLEWVAVSGRGTVHAVTIMRPRPPQAPYNVVLVDLEEGPRMMSRIEGLAPEAVRIGMAVQARIATQDDKPLVVFDAVGTKEGL
ncbi:OB-fold domain-containing protein [Polaromonas sp. P1(28)-13]|nr:OB-fold domain-containing protein [Polaromonas sp. P1(28)-13]